MCSGSSKQAQFDASAVTSFCSRVDAFVERSRCQLQAANALSDDIKLHGAAVRNCIDVGFAVHLSFTLQVSRLFGEDEFSSSPIDLCSHIIAFADNLERAWQELQCNNEIIPSDAVERMRRAEKESEQSPRK
jgi:hypothetical protein